MPANCQSSRPALCKVKDLDARWCTSITCHVSAALCERCDGLSPYNSIRAAGEEMIEHAVNDETQRLKDLEDVEL